MDRLIYHMKRILLKRVLLKRQKKVFKQNTLFNQLFEQTCGSKKDFAPFQSHQPIKTNFRAIAFYLPQFHPIPENDAWWGKGFTEWTNVSKAIPQFLGHYQPHLPGELGFYDLRLPEIQRRQIELAKNYGLYGFCYHYYWFSGRKLLNRPLETILADKTLDFPFCICWANENWTRRWDGMEDDVLIQQDHSAEDDTHFIRDIEIVLSDSRYIRIDGRPLLIIYRPDLFPNLTMTVKKWRDYCIAAGLGDLFLVACKTFSTKILPTGFDALVEFPPHHILDCADLIKKSNFINLSYRGKTYSYPDLVESMSKLTKPSFQLFRTVFPSWDNEARKPGRGDTFVYSNPELYKKWLSDSIRYTKTNNQDQIVFINAWNEWAEGAHLEPDRKYGYAWLQATYEALLATEEQ